MKPIYLTGKALWAKVPPGEMDKKFNRWTIGVILDEKSWFAYKEANLELKLRETDSGEEYVQFARDDMKKIGPELVKLGPPAVFGEDGQPLTEKIGNDSIVTVKISTYKTQKGNAHRLEAIKVDKLVKYEEDIAKLALSGKPDSWDAPPA